jgi:K+ transporter
MSTGYRVLAVLGAVCLLATLSMYATPHWASVMLAAVSFLGLAIFLITSAILGIARWRRTSGVWMLPTVVCAAIMLVAWFVPKFGRHLADRQFKRSLSKYQEVVAEIKNTQNFRSPELNIVSTGHQVYGVRAIKAARCADGTVVVAFLLDVNVPLLHEGYVYDGSQENTTCLGEKAKPENNWPYIRPVIGSWFHFSDQPGL